MKRELVEQIVNPREYNKHWYTEEGWEHLTNMATSLEKVMRLCNEHGLTKELHDIMYLTEEDYAYRLYEFYQYLKENK